METVIHKTIDGHEIIVGFSRPSIDPVETNKIVNDILAETDEWKAAEAMKSKYNCAVTDMKVAAQSRNDIKYKAALAAMSVRQDELKPLARDLAAKVIALRLENAVHFTPRAGEVIRDASEIKALREAIQGAPQGILITLDGSTVEDNRGKVFFRKSGGKWGRTHIVRLGDPVPGDATLQADVTPEQAIEIERDLIAALPTDVNLKEKERALTGAMKSAATMRNELEIQADSDALTKSQDWYKGERSRIEGLYG